MTARTVLSATSTNRRVCISTGTWPPPPPRRPRRASLASSHERTKGSCQMWRAEGAVHGPRLRARGRGGCTWRARRRERARTTTSFSMHAAVEAATAGRPGARASTHAHNTHRALMHTRTPRHTHAYQASNHQARPGARSRTYTTHISTPRQTSVGCPPRGAPPLPKQVLHEQTGGCRSSPAAARYLAVSSSIFRVGRVTRPTGAEPWPPPPEQQRRRELHLRLMSSRPEMCSVGVD